MSDSGIWSGPSGCAAASCASCGHLGRTPGGPATCRGVMPSLLSLGPCLHRTSKHRGTCVLSHPTAVKVLCGLRLLLSTCCLHGRFLCELPRKCHTRTQASFPVVGHSVLPLPCLGAPCPLDPGAWSAAREWGRKTAPANTTAVSTGHRVAVQGAPLTTRLSSVSEEGQGAVSQPLEKPR